MLLVSGKHYCRGNNGELGRVACDVQRAGGVVREDAGGGNMNCKGNGLLILHLEEVLGLI